MKFYVGCVNTQAVRSAHHNETRKFAKPEDLSSDVKDHEAYLDRWMKVFVQRNHLCVGELSFTPREYVDGGPCVCFVLMRGVDPIYFVQTWPWGDGCEAPNIDFTVWEAMDALSLYEASDEQHLIDAGPSDDEGEEEETPEPEVVEPEVVEKTPEAVQSEEYELRITRLENAVYTLQHVGFETRPILDALRKDVNLLRDRVYLLENPAEFIS